jgi:pyruvate/2-oxoglutarate dehydrogenase complex dihydrolipoamide dehydrogenase (E3) component
VLNPTVSVLNNTFTNQLTLKFTTPNTEIQLLSQEVSNFMNIIHNLGQITKHLYRMTPTTSRTSPMDVLIIGAGPAGLAASLGLSRLQYKCIVFSSNEFRNYKSKHMHGVPTWEHKDPAEFRAATRKDIVANYSTTFFEEVGIKSLEKSGKEGGGTLFKATDENGKEWWGRKVVLATGIKDIMLDIEGYEECWVKGM